MISILVESKLNEFVNFELHRFNNPALIDERLIISNSSLDWFLSTRTNKNKIIYHYS